MKCFDHPAIDAIAVCKHCGKGLCADSAVDTGFGMACEGACVVAVNQWRALMDASTAATRINRGGALYLLPGFFAVIGLVFALESLWSGRPARSGYFSLIMGVVFLVFGVALAIVQYVWKKRSQASA